MASVSTLINRMRYWCAVANMGYSQADRWNFNPSGGNCDCSSLVIHCLREAGFDTGSATYTGNLSDNLTKRGWTRLPANGNPQPGDILLNDLHHVAVYLGGGKLAQASISERGTAYGRAGDQTGRETNIRAYYSYPWDCYLRYQQASANNNPGRLAVDGLAGRATISRWQEIMGTPVDGVVSGQVIPDGRTYGRPNLLSVTYGGQGSALIRAVQRVVGAVPDGLYGPDSIRRTQIRLGVDPDCWFGYATARALQERLNQGRF
ncbi:N-acetylmuramoyl-L-alanine amidase [Bifidobacterium phage PMBT6]|nr:N-acetylmuramoyl-L-alanine amidase [Bifidobacterium phage PMBT6]QDF14894.1 N-acetylmuramoyl-L-alanine amidase [Bifidobacterium phage PMBT6]